MEQVEVQPVDPEPPEAGLEVPGERRRAKPVGTDAGVGVAALADQEEPLPEAAGGHPAPEETFGPAELVRGREVEGRAPRLHQRVQVPELLLPAGPRGEPVGEDAAQAGGADDDAGDRRHSTRGSAAAAVGARPGSAEATAVHSRPRRICAPWMSKASEAALAAVSARASAPTTSVASVAPSCPGMMSPSALPTISIPRVTSVRTSPEGWPMAARATPHWTTCATRPAVSQASERRRSALDAPAAASKSAPKRWRRRLSPPRSRPGLARWRRRRMLPPSTPATTPLARTRPAVAPGPSSASVASSSGTTNAAVDSSTTLCICTAATAARAPPVLRLRSSARAASPEPRPIGSTSPTA